MKSNTDPERLTLIYIIQAVILTSVQLYSTLICVVRLELCIVRLEHATKCGFFKVFYHVELPVNNFEL